MTPFCSFKGMLQFVASIKIIKHNYQHTKVNNSAKFQIYPMYGSEKF